MDTQPIETISGTNGLCAHLYQDEDAESPRVDFDNLGRIATVHLRRHVLKDKGEDYLPEDLGNWDEVEAYLRRERGAAVVMPVFLYDHSGISISTGSFVGRAPHASWDSGQVGLVYARGEDIRRWYGVKRLSKATLDMAAELVKAEVETFNQYLSGDVYWYKIVRTSTCDKCGNSSAEDLESLGGLYGYEYAKKEAMAAIEALEKKYAKEG